MENIISVTNVEKTIIVNTFHVHLVTSFLEKVLSTLMTFKLYALVIYFNVMVQTLSTAQQVTTITPPSVILRMKSIVLLSLLCSFLQLSSLALVCL